MTFKTRARHAVVACTASAALAVSGCANMGAGGYLGALAGGAGGAALGDSMDSGDGLMTLLWAVAGMSLGAAMGNGALTPGELAQGMADAQRNMEAEEAARYLPPGGYSDSGSSDTSTSSSSSTSSASRSGGTARLSSPATSDDGLDRTIKKWVWCQARGGVTVQRAGQSWVSSIGLVEVSYRDMRETGLDFQEGAEVKWREYLREAKGVIPDYLLCSTYDEEFFDFARSRMDEYSANLRDGTEMNYTLYNPTWAYPN